MNKRDSDQRVALKHLDDAELVARAKNELPYVMRAYEELMMRHERILYAVCLRLTGNKADAEDATQDAMLKAFAGLNSFKGESTFKTWLLRIASNTCTDKIKKKAVATRYAEKLKHEPIEHHADAEEEGGVLPLLSQLQPDDRQVLTLRYVADLDLQEISDALGIGLSATKMRLYRATDKLRKLAVENGLAMHE